MDFIAVCFLQLHHANRTPRRRTIVTKSQNGGQAAQIAPVVPLHTIRANGFVAAGVEKCWSRVDRSEMHDVFIVISEDAYGDHIARTIYAADLDDARQTHHDNYADEPIVAIHQ